MRTLILAGVAAVGFAMAGATPSISAPASNTTLGNSNMSTIESMTTDVRRRRYCQRNCHHRILSARRCHTRCWWR